MSKKIKIKKAIYGKKQFNLPEELDYYKRYKMINIPNDLVDDIHQAVGRAEGFIPCKDIAEELDAWQFLIDTGIVWKLHGWMGRQAHFLIENKILKERVVH